VRIGTTSIFVKYRVLSFMCAHYDVGRQGMKSRLNKSLDRSPGRPGNTKGESANNKGRHRVSIDCPKEKILSQSPQSTARSTGKKTSFKKRAQLF